MLWEASLTVGMAHNIFFFLDPRLLVDAMCIDNDNYHKAVKNSLLQGCAASDPPSANGTASTSLLTPGAAPTSLSAYGATSASLSSGGAAPTLLALAPYADGAKWHRASRFRNHYRATKYSH